MRVVHGNADKRVVSSYLAALFLGLFLFPLPGGNALAVDAEDAQTGKLIEGAKKEGELLWYTSANLENSARFLKMFQEKYPFIKARMYRGDSGDMINRITSEFRAKKHTYDATQLNLLDGEFLNRGGHFAKYLSPQRKFYPESFKDHEGYWTAPLCNLNVMAYNTRLVSSQEAPKSFEDLLQPKWKGKIGMPTDSYYWFAAVLKSMGEERGLAYFKRLAGQNIQFRLGKTLNTQLLMAGELSISMPLYNYRIEEMKGKGAPVDWIAIDPGKKVIPQMNALSISANAPHPNAARLFVDLLLSREIQEIIAGIYGFSPRTDVGDRLPRVKKDLDILPFDPGIADDYNKYVAIYHKIMLKK